MKLFKLTLLFLMVAGMLFASNPTFPPTSGDSAPTHTPSAVGMVYVDTTNDTFYISVDTSASTDWIQSTGGTVSGGFLDTDGNTIQHFDGFDDNNSISGNGNGDTLWALTGTDSTVSSNITLGAVNKNVTARIFSGTANYLRNNTSAVLTNNIGDFTVDAIIRPDNLTTGGGGRVWGNIDNNVSANGIQLLANSVSSGNLNLLCYESGTLVANLQFTNLVGSVEGNWIHVVVSYKDSTTTIKLAYKVGDLITDMSGGTGGAGQPDAITSDVSAGDAFGSPTNMYVGNGITPNTDSADNGFEGAIAEVRFSTGVRYE